MRRCKAASIGVCTALLSIAGCNDWTWRYDSGAEFTAGKGTLSRGIDMPATATAITYAENIDVNAFFAKFSVKDQSELSQLQQHLEASPSVPPYCQPGWGGGWWRRAIEDLAVPYHTLNWMRSRYVAETFYLIHGNDVYAYYCGNSGIVEPPAPRE